MTNREKFIETFGVKPLNSIGCHNLGCSEADCNVCTFNKGAKPGFIWDLEYKEPPKHKIKVGDKVKIIDAEEQYTTYNALFNNSKLSKEVISNFNRGVDLNTYCIYKVLEILEHENYDGVYIAVIQNDYDEIYLIGVNGLEVIK